MHLTYTGLWMCAVKLDHLKEKIFFSSRCNGAIRFKRSDASEKIAEEQIDK